LNIKEFLRELHRELDIKSIDSLKESTDLHSLEEWDSMTSMIFTVFIEDHFNINVTQEQIKEFNNLSDVINFIGKEKFE